MINIELKSEKISYEELQELLNLSHKSNEEKGLKYGTQNQTIDMLKEKLRECDCYVAILDGMLVGTATIGYKSLNYWYCNERCAVIKLVGVHPDYKGKKLVVSY